MTEIYWTLEERKPSELSAYIKNPRRLTKEQAKQLEASLDKFGQCQPLVINSDNTVIGGHQRLQLLKRLKYKSVQVYTPNRPLDDKEIEELNIRLNRNNGEFDFDILANCWETTDLLEWGFSADELGLKEEEPDLEDDEPVEGLPAVNPETRLGDLYTLNDHRILCGDSTNKDSVSILLNGMSPNLMVTDPPYGVDYDPDWRNVREIDRKTSSKSVGIVENDEIADWSEAWKLFPGDVAYVWHASLFTHVVAESLQSCDFELINLIVWNKSHYAISRGDYHWKHEVCWYAVRKDQLHNWQGSRKESTVWDIGISTKHSQDTKTKHSTQKPIEIMAKPMLNNSQAGDSVYDPFLGSGTSLMAAEKNNRVCLGMELSPEYCDIITDRWVQYKIKQNEPYTVTKNGVEV